MKKIITTEYILTKEEMSVISRCLVYCRHRLKEHTNSGIAKCVKLEQVKKILKDLEVN